MEHNPEGVPVPFDFHYVSKLETKGDVLFHGRGGTHLERLTIDVTTARAKFHGENINLDQHIKDWIKDACNESMKTFPSEKLPEGVYDRNADSTREFEEGEFLLDDRDIQSSSLHVAFKVRVLRPAVISNFEVASRGRVLSIAPVTV